MIKHHIQAAADPVGMVLPWTHHPLEQVNQSTEESLTDSQDNQTDMWNSDIPGQARVSLEIKNFKFTMDMGTDPSNAASFARCIE